MKIISKCERQFIWNCINRQKRLDGREFGQGRNLEVVFGKERGCCLVVLGNTRVLVQISSELTEPKEITPNEGIIHINFEPSQMQSLDVTVSHTSDEAIEAQRLLERCIRDSKSVDLESLCIIAGSKVWTIRVDIHPLNDDGNLIECASIGAISALAHFRRPEVTIQQDNVIVHSVIEKEPAKLNIRHMPITINLAIFRQGKCILVDPIELEEKVCDGCYIIGMNAHQELCFVHRRGVLLLKEAEILRIQDIAMRRAQEITQIIRTALDDDAYKRATKASFGISHLIRTGTILGAKRPMAEISLETVQNMRTVENDVKHSIEDDFDHDQFESSENGKRVIGDTSEIRSQAKERALNILQESEAVVFEGGPSKWDENTDSEVSEEEEVSAEAEPAISTIKQEPNSDSEEETVYMNKEQLDKKASDKRGWFIKDPFA